MPQQLAKYVQDTISIGVEPGDLNVENVIHKIAGVRGFLHHAPACSR